MWGLAPRFPWFLGWMNEEGAACIYACGCIPQPHPGQDTVLSADACSATRMAISQSRSLDAEAPLAERKSPVHRLPLMEMRDMPQSSNLLLHPEGDYGQGWPHPALSLDPAPNSCPARHSESPPA